MDAQKKVHTVWNADTSLLYAENFLTPQLLTHTTAWSITFHLGYTTASKHMQGWVKVYIPLDAKWVILDTFFLVNSKQHRNTTTITTTILRPFFRDHPGELVPEQNSWTLWCMGRLTEADTSTIRLGATPSGPTSAHLHHPPFFTGRMPFLLRNQQCQSTEGSQQHGNKGKKTKSKPMCKENLNQQWTLKLHMCMCITVHYCTIQHRTVLIIGSRPSDHSFRSVCLSVCLFVCLFVQSFCQPSLIRFGSN